jgi:hypothetical protein
MIYIHMAENCIYCRTTEKIIKHHLSYNPEIIVPCCLSCHREMHHQLPKISTTDRRISVNSAVRRRYSQIKARRIIENAELLVVDDDLRAKINSLL